MNAFFDFLKSLGPSRIAAMGAVSLGLIGFFAFFILRISTPPMVPLYTDLSFEDSSAILSELDSRAVPYELRQDGAVVMIPRDQVLRTRMDLANQGLPSGGGVGYEIFDKSDTLGTTSFVQNINHLRAMEGELSRSIRTLRGVQQARVHLVLPERQLFARERPTPSASIVLQTRGVLDTGQIRAVQHLVAAAVEGLTPARVSVVDETGKLLADGRGDPLSSMASSLEERRLQIESGMSEKIEALVASIVGHSRMRVRVNADLDSRRITETANIFDPEARVVRSTQTRESQSNVREPVPDDGVTVGNELPNAQAANGADGDATQDEQTIEEVVNYEISNKTRTEVQEAGQIKRLSVAVVVDGVYTRDAEGNMTYTARDEAELERIAALVRSAVGFDEARGDSVEIANLRFAEPPVNLSANAVEPMVSLTKDDYFYIAETAVLMLLAILVLLFVVRPLVRKILAEQPKPEAELAALPSAEGGEVLADGTVNPALPEPEPKDDLILQAQVAGELQQQTVGRVGEMVHNNPTEASTIIRQWLQEAA